MIILLSSNADIYNENKLSFVLETFLKDLKFQIGNENKTFEFLHYTHFPEIFKVKNIPHDVEHQTFDTDSLVDKVTSRYNENAVIYISEEYVLSNNIDMLKKRPFFVHIHIEFEITLLLKLLDISQSSILNFIKIAENKKHQHASVHANPTIKINVNSNADIDSMDGFRFTSALSQSFKKQLLEIPMFQSLNLATPQGRTSPMRPSWDEYFMQLANLASTRSNCMKRKVGCCIVSNNKVIATGYNGTPRHLLNCFSGGCKRCNVTSIAATSSQEPKNVHNLGTCYCLHAEENALLEAGNIRIDKSCTLYCDTCPCITCSVKIVQAGVGEVVYSQSYNMDGESIAIFDNAGIKIRQFDHSGIKKEYTFVI